MVSCEPRNLVALVIEEWIGFNEKSAHPRPGKLGKSSFDFAVRTGINDLDPHRHCDGSSPNLFLDGFCKWVLRINKQPDGISVRYQLDNQLQPLCHQL